MTPVPDKAPMVKDMDVVCPGHGGKPVADQDCRPSFDDFFELPEDLRFCKVYKELAGSSRMTILAALKNALARAHLQPFSGALVPARRASKEALRRGPSLRKPIFYLGMNTIDVRTFHKSRCHYILNPILKTGSKKVIF